MTETEEDMICGLTAVQHDVLREGLRELPETMPPRAVWQRIREQAEAEGLLSRRPIQRHFTLLGGVGLAAAMLLAVLVIPRNEVPEYESRTEPPALVQTNQRPLNALQALMVQSSQLESDLRALPEEPRVVRAGTVASISEIEDRIAAIDYQLGDPALIMTAEEQELFWQERVRLMKSLVQLRYAQAQRTAF